MSGLCHPCLDVWPGSLAPVSWYLSAAVRVEVCELMSSSDLVSLQLSAAFVYASTLTCLAHLLGLDVIPGFNPLWTYITVHLHKPP